MNSCISFSLVRHEVTEQPWKSLVGTTPWEALSDWVSKTDANHVCWHQTCFCTLPKTNYLLLFEMINHSGISLLICYPMPCLITLRKRLQIIFYCARRVSTHICTRIYWTCAILQLISSGSWVKFKLSACQVSKMLLLLWSSDTKILKAQA